MTALLLLQRATLLRAGVTRVATAVLVVVAPVLCAAFLAASGAARGQVGPGPAAQKIGALLIGRGWTAYLGLVADVLSVATLLVVGFVVAWSVGRELTDGTASSLLVLPASRSAVVVAKLATVLAWAAAAVTAAVVVALALGPLAGLGAPGGEVLAAAAKAWVVGALAALLAVPVGLVATLGRGPLPGVGALLGVVVVTQVLVTFGAGAWFPWAAPSLWAGMGGREAMEAVTPVQLLAVLPVAVAGAAATAAAWERLELR